MGRKGGLTLGAVFWFSLLALALQGTVMVFPDLVVSTPERFDSANTFPLPLLVDRELSTTWTFKWDFNFYPCDWDQDGIGSWIKIETLSETEIRSLEIINGYAKLWPVRYIENNAVMALVVQDSAGGKQVVYFDDDCQDFQPIPLKKPANKVTLIIDDIRNGTKYNDTCIGEMAVFDTKGVDLIRKWPYYVFTYGEKGRIWQVRDLNAQIIYTATNNNINWATVNLNGDLLAFYGQNGVEVYDAKKSNVTKLFAGQEVNEAKFDGRKLTVKIGGKEETYSF